MSRLTNRTPEQVQAFRDALERGESLESAKLAAGYSAHVARKGRTGMPKDLLKVLIQSGKRYIDLGKEISAQDQEALVRGRLVANAIEGKDAGVNSLKLLGQDKRVNMFQSDSIAGIVVIEAPRALPVAQDVPVLEAEEVKMLGE